MGIADFFSFGWLKWPGLPPGLDIFFNWTSSSFWIALISALAGAYLLSQKTADTGAFNFPVNLAALFFGAATANWIGRDVPLPLEATVQVPAILSMIGMCFVGLTIIWLVRRG
jgi:hypothetical protein